MKAGLLLVNGLVAVGMAMPTSSSVVHEKRDVRDSQFVKRGSLSPNATVPVRIALKQKDLDKGMDYLLEVSDPSSAKYGQHYDSTGVTNLFAPDAKSVAAVKNWLIQNGIPANKITLSSSKGWLNFRAPVGKVEALFNTKYNSYYLASKRDKTYIGADQYSLPSDISQHVDFVTPGVAFASATQKHHGLEKTPLPPGIFKQLADGGQASSCDEHVTPECIKAQYKIPDGKLKDPSNLMGIFEQSSTDPNVDSRASDIFCQDDLDAFFAKSANYIPKGTGPKLNLLNGAKAPVSQDKAGIESDMDFELAMPLIYPQSTALFQSNFQGNQDGFELFLDAIDSSYCGGGGNNGTMFRRDGGTACGTVKPTNVISFSWGGPETVGQDQSAKMLERQCNEYMKLGLQGVSLVFSSGDSGVAGDDNKCLGSSGKVFVPTFPASCPYVTTVGSTYLPKGSKSGDQEVVTQRFSPGGGFSNVFPQPSYQQAAVGQYFKEHDPGYKSYDTKEGQIPDDGGIFNRNGRGFPDMAAFGDNAVVIAQGKPFGGGGTSMSAPIVAAVFTRINDERIKAGKKPIGFANPALYKNPAMFNDIVKGDQAMGGVDESGQTQPSGCGNKGFSAVQGWDPVSGLGTPNYEAMLEYFLKL